MAQTGFGQGTNELYDRARPSYPVGVLSIIKESIKPSTELNIVEIGAGTGIFTRALLAQPWSSSIRALKAVEPSQGMRDVFSSTITDDRVTVAEGTFDNTNVEAGWADAVIIAQAFHWCQDFDKAIAHFAHILKPDGVIIFTWNMEDRETAEWVNELRDLYEQHDKGVPQFRLGLWRQAFDTEAYKKFFVSPPTEKEWSYSIDATAPSVEDRVFSKSYITVLPPAEKEKLSKGIASIVAVGKGRVWKDESKGIFEYPYKNLVVVANRQ